MFVDVSRNVDNRVTEKCFGADAMSDILHARCWYTRDKILTVITPTEKILSNAASNSFVCLETRTGVSSFW